MRKCENEEITKVLIRGEVGWRGEMFCYGVSRVVGIDN